MSIALILTLDGVNAEKIYAGARMVGFLESLLEFDQLPEIHKARAGELISEFRATETFTRNVKAVAGCPHGDCHARAACQVEKYCPVARSS